MKFAQVVLILLLTLAANVVTHRCSRYPSNTYTSKSPVDEHFGISITGNAQTYILGQSYNVSLHAYNGHRFISAKIVLENENGENSVGEDLGRLELVETVETRYSQQCAHMIESTNTNPKARLDMVWTAPTEAGNGCVLIRATVLQHRDVWFMDDGGLTKRICEEVVDNLESQKRDSEETPCCACDEARYELIFEGLWSRNLHPKNFPNSGWITRFTNILGAAHSSDYRFWDNGELASAEMQEFAEHGSSLGLEREFSEYFREGKIRTVIKARGPAFPYINTPSTASVRVDPLHHQISIASKVVPSPDWIVGVPGLELCFDNCTWLEQKVINLYPWDVGTDAGPAYTSPDQPQFPADVIRRMSSEYPPDPRSPFFDETHAPMKPLATLTIKRQRLYERKCEDEESNNLEMTSRECFTHPWSAWSKCSAECGNGHQYRTRVYKQPDIANIYNCDAIVQRKQERECVGEKCTGMQTNFANSNQMDDMEDDQMFEPAMPQTPIRSSYQDHESPNISPAYKNYQQELPPVHTEDPFESDYTQQNSQELRKPQEYSFQAEDLRQESNEEHLTSLKPKKFHNKNNLPMPPVYCYQRLDVIHGCNDPRVVGNFWFYNYCTDECMLYATDICDNNRNKFHSLEQCEEHCATPMRSLEQFLRQKQMQTCAGAKRKERNFKKRRNFHLA